jgi:hypothetical protein
MLPSEYGEPRVFVNVTVGQDAVDRAAGAEVVLLEDSFRIRCK